MGRYDNCYEAESLAEYDRKQKHYRKTVLNSIDKMDIDELKFIADVATNIDEYLTFFKVLKKNIK